MLTAISRYGGRVIPELEGIVEGCRRRGELVQGPHLAAFEEAFARAVGGGRAITAPLGRMAFFYILKALRLPPGSEIIVPALTFWVIPEMARVAGLKVVFADVNPLTFNLDPVSFERAITDKTRAVVPTHLFGLPCDMDAILAIAGRHNLAVVEDCAHALGATYKGRQVGTFGAGALFSFQTLKPLNTHGGGMAIVRDAEVAERVAVLSATAAWPDAAEVERRLRIGRLSRVFMRPAVFTCTAFPVLWCTSWFHSEPNVYQWESIRRLDPVPKSYLLRYSNVQAAIGLAGLARLDEWNATTRAHARTVDEALRDLPGVTYPQAPPDRTHVYYQYCAYVPDHDRLVHNCIRRGVDVETRHVDVCTRLELFGEERCEAPGADRAADVVQIPVYSTLTDQQVRRVASVVRRMVLRQASPVHA